VAEVPVQPTAAAKKYARWGLKARREAPRSKKGGLTTREAGRQGVGSGVARASSIVRGKKIDAARAKAFFDRHGHNYQAAMKRAKSSGKPLREAATREPAIQSWWLWGGDPLRKQAERAVAKAEKNPKLSPIPEKYRQGLQKMAEAREQLWDETALSAYEDGHAYDAAKKLGPEQWAQRYAWPRFVERIRPHLADVDAVTMSLLEDTYVEHLVAAAAGESLLEGQPPALPGAERPTGALMPLSDDPGAYRNPEGLAKLKRRLMR